MPGGAACWLRAYNLRSSVVLKRSLHKSAFALCFIGVPVRKRVHYMY